MTTLRISLKQDFSRPYIGSNLERQVADWIIDWHNLDAFQEEINMGLAASGIPANVIKVGGPIDTLSFLVEPYPAPNKPARVIVPRRR